MKCPIGSYLNPKRQKGVSKIPSSFYIITPCHKVESTDHNVLDMNFHAF
jgi:hypothetical protein